MTKKPKAKDNPEIKRENPKTGRPSTYKPEYAQQAQKLCVLGATDAELADFFGVSIATVSNWKGIYSDFVEALKVGKAAADDRVERSLFHRAVGYTYESEKVFQFQGQIIRTPILEHVPPDTTAQIFWLKNRRSKEWRDVRQHEVGEPGAFAAMSDVEVLAQLQEEAARLGIPLPAVPRLNGKSNGTAH